MIHEAMAMEMATVEAELVVPVTGVTEGTAPELEAAVAPEVVVEAHVDVHPGRARK
jgi:hypothetical protein